MMAVATIAAQQQQQFFSELQQQQQQARAAAAFMMPNAATSLYNPTAMPTYSNSSPLANLFAAAATAQNSQAMNLGQNSQPGGIFPQAQFSANFGHLNGPNSLFSNAATGLRNSMSNE